MPRSALIKPLLRPLLLAPFCWLSMMWIHESGHVLGCILSGGKIAHLTLDPRTFSRTDPASDPHPLLTVWSGHLLGSLAPLIATLAFPRIALLRLLAAFCLLANGLYICYATFAPRADAAGMRKRGSPLFTLWLFGLAAIAASLPLFHSLGPRLSFTKSPSPYTKPQMITATLLTLTMILLGLFLFPDR
ncbi:MAG: M50 family metallopeptidase [Phycisphaerae bacterium]